MALLLRLILILSTLGIIWASNIELLECDPPDYPQWGGYGPKQDFYVPGDSIHYFCDVDTYIGGNFYRRCEDTGDWSGDAPVCDSPSSFSIRNQSSTADSEDENHAENAADNSRNTCSSTKSGEAEYWFGKFVTPGQLIRVMVFLPKVEVAYEVFMIKENGQEISCGSKRGRIDRYEWVFHNCPEPHNTGIMGMRIKSISTLPLQLCEISAFVLTAPTCVDPHVRILNGRFQLSRKTASLVCDNGYTRSPDARLQCVRNGMWNRKPLYCLEREWEMDGNGPAGGPSEREPANSPERQRRP